MLAHFLVQLLVPVGMTGPSAAGLSYSLFSDSGELLIGGNATGSWVSGTGTGAAQGLNCIWKNPANQTALIGNYTDTVTVTVTF